MDFVIDKNARYIIDYDGVFQYYATEGVDTSKIHNQDFANFFAKHAKKLKKLNNTIINLVKELNLKNIQVFILTGRTKKLLGKFTESLLKKENLKINKIIYFPENYDSSQYYDWKQKIILNNLKENFEKKLYVYDDDIKLLNLLKNKVNDKNLKIFYYKIFKNGKEEYKKIK